LFSFTDALGVILASTDDVEFFWPALMTVLMIEIPVVCSKVLTPGTREAWIPGSDSTGSEPPCDPEPELKSLLEPEPEPEPGIFLLGSNYFYKLPPNSTSPYIDLDIYSVHPFLLKIF